MTKIHWCKLSDGTKYAPVRVNTDNQEAMQARELELHGKSLHLLLNTQKAKSKVLQNYHQTKLTLKIVGNQF